MSITELQFRHGMLLGGGTAVFLVFATMVAGLFMANPVVLLLLPPSLVMAALAMLELVGAIAVFPRDPEAVRSQLRAGAGNDLATEVAGR